MSEKIIAASRLNLLSGWSVILEAKLLFKHNFKKSGFLDLSSLNSGKYLPACLINQTGTQEKSLLLISDNKKYEPYKVDNNDIIEIWEAIAFFSLDLPRPDSEYSSLKDDINNLYSNLDELKNKL